MGDGSYFECKVEINTNQEDSNSSLNEKEKTEVVHNNMHDDGIHSSSSNAIDGKESTTKKSDLNIQCQFCDEQFSSNKLLKKHMKKHPKAKELRFLCTTCPMRFGQISHLTQHLNTHTEERGFKCEECSHLFKRKGDLKQHMKIHTGMYHRQVGPGPFFLSEIIETFLLHN